MSSAEQIADQRAGRSSVRAAIGRLSKYIASNRTYYAIWSVITLAYVATFLIIPELTGRTVGAIEAGDPTASIVRLAVWLAGIGVLSGVLRYFSRVLVFNAAREIEYEMRNDLFAHLQRLPQSFFLSWRTGDLMSRCVNDLNSVRTLLGPGLLSVVGTPLQYVGAFAMMFWMDWQLTLLVLVPYPFFIQFARTFGRGLHRWNIEVQEGLGELSNQLQETISGISVVKTHAMEDITRDRFAKSNENLFRKQLKLVRVSGAMPAIIGLLPGLAMLIILWVGGTKILVGQMTTKEFITFAMLIYGLTFPTFILGWVFALIQRGAAAMQRIDEVLTVEPSIADRPDAVEIESLRGEIEFRDLTFRYPSFDREPALHNISLTVPAGTTLGIVGPVGSGKSTLASVIPRLFEVDDGHVFIDGVDVNQLKLKTLRSNIAMVPQDSFLFSMSLAENIAFGLP
ncbi:MAG: ATP-binding cassette domain-containing protein, partial [Myxococcales bacterium]|nr:ATP-binding cassette domain-containing protein [Myxococcales bacterium]